MEQTKTKRLTGVLTLAAILGVGAAVVTVAPANAWGPERDTYTMAQPADHVVFDSITDNPDVGDERNFLRVRDADSKYWAQGTTNGWTDTVDMQEGHTYDVRLYVHNNAGEVDLAKDPTKYAAHTAADVRANINLPIGENVYGKQFEVNGKLSYTTLTEYEANKDTAKYNTIWDNIVLKSDKAFHVKAVSYKYYNNVKTEKDGGFDLAANLFTTDEKEKGTLLGYDKMDGLMPGCLKYSGYVLVKIQPVFTDASYDIAKTVDQQSAKPGDTVKYTITATNTGKSDLHNVKVTDKLPDYYDDVTEGIDAPKTTKYSGSFRDEGNTITFDTLKAGEKATITVSYKVRTNVGCGNATLTNVVSGTTDETDTEDKTDNNSAVVTVNGPVCPAAPKAGSRLGTAIASFIGFLALATLAILFLGRKDFLKRNK